MKYIISIAIILISANLYAQAVGVPRSHNQLTGTGTNSHATIDTFISSKGQVSGLASLDASGNLAQSAGTATGYVKQTNGTATGTTLYPKHLPLEKPRLANGMPISLVKLKFNHFRKFLRLLE